MTVADTVNCSWVDLIGVPYVLGARGPDSYDCYGLMMELHRRQGIEIKDYKSPTIPGEIAALFVCEAAVRWNECKNEIGACLLIRAGGMIHIAMMLNEFDMIHTWKDSGGVVVERVQPWLRKIIGFYRYAK